jgi:hypothetical protein
MIDLGDPRYITNPQPGEFGTGLGSSFGDPSFWSNVDSNGELVPGPGSIKIEEILPTVGLVTILIAIA